MKSFKVIICLLLIPLLMTGCKSTGRNLRDMSIVEGMGVDFSEDKVQVTVQMLNLFKEGTGSEALSGNVTINTEGSGASISSAIKGISQKISKNLFFGQNRIVVFGKEFAEKELKSNLDYFLRSGNSRADLLLCMTEDTAKKTMESKENDAIVPAESIASLLISGEAKGISARVSVNELLNLYKDKTSDMYLPVIECGKENVSVSGIAIYSEDKLAKILKEGKEIQGLLFLKNKIKAGMIMVEHTELGKTAIEITKARSKSKASYKDGQIILEEKIKVDIKLNETEKGIEMPITSKQLNEIKALTEQEIAKMCDIAFKECAENKSDCIRIGENLAMRDPTAYKELSDNWDKYLKNAKLKVDVSCSVSRINEHSKKD